MNPSIGDGSIVQLNPFSITEGDVVLYYSHGSLILHRFIKQSGQYAYIKGDAEDHVDKVHIDKLIASAILVKDPAIQGDTIPLSIHKCQLSAKINLCVGINSHGLLLEVKLEKI